MSGLRRLAWAFSRRARLATVETRVPPSPAANASHPTEPNGQRVTSHRAHRPTRCAATGNNLAFPFARAFVQAQRAAPHRASRPTRRVPPDPAANAPHPTEPAGQRAAPHRACRPTRRAETGNSPASPFARGFCTGATPCFRRGHKAAPYIQLQLFLQLKSAPSPEVEAGLL